jgi:hypothetical protein
MNYLSLPFGTQSLICTRTSRVFRRVFAIVVCALGTSIASPFCAEAQTAQTSLQIIHNSPDPQVSPVTVWAGIPVGTSVQFFPIAPNLNFRGASARVTGAPPLLPTLESLVGLSLAANITSVTNSSATPAIRALTGLRLGRGANLVFVRGVLDTAGYARNPNNRPRSLSLSLVTDTLSTIPAGQTRILVYHGTTDADLIDLTVRETGDQIAVGLALDEIIAYIIPTGDYTIDVRSYVTKALIGSFSARLQTLGYSGQRITIMASGFQNPAQNKNGAAFGLVAVPNFGDATPVLLPTAPPPPAPTEFPIASLQAIHASADPTATPVGIWLGTSLLGGMIQFLPIQPNFPFRTATPAISSISSGFGQIPLSNALNMPFDINITSGGAVSATPAVRSFTGYSLLRGANFTLAEGVLDTTRFARNPDGQSTRFTLIRLLDTASTLAADRTRLVIAHAVTDAPRVDVVVRDLGRVGPIQFAGNAAIAELPTNDYILDVVPSGTSTVLASFRANLRTQNLAGKRVLITATGFLNPAQNQGGAGLGLLASVNDSTGRYFMLPSVTVGVRDNAGLTVQTGGMTILPIAPNPVRDFATLSYEIAEPTEITVSVMDGRGGAVWQQERQFTSSGRHTMNLDASTWAQGSYIVRMTNSNGNSVLARLVVVR